MTKAEQEVVERFDAMPPLKRAGFLMWLTVQIEANKREGELGAAHALALLALLLTDRR